MDSERCLRFGKSCPTQQRRDCPLCGLTATQQFALKALTNHGGEGVMTKTGTMLARGAELGHGDDGEGCRDEGVDFFQRSTWKSLLAAGRIQEVAPKRYRVVQS